MNDVCQQQECCEQALPRDTKLSRRVPLLNEAMPSCEYYPVSIDVERRLISFARISRTTYRKSAFLVPRHTNMGRRLYTFNLDDLLLRNMMSPVQSAPTHYVLISAFCCSTLLARYLDQVERCLVLKEPAMVAQLGFLRYREHDLPVEEWESEWRQLAALGLGLMSRAFAADDTVLIKPSDIGNCVGDVVLDHDPRSKSVLLSVTLRTFILSVLKSNSRREWTRGRVKFWKPIVTAFSPLAEIELQELDDAKKSAYLWLINNAFWSELRAKVGSERVLILNGEDVSRLPVATLTKVLEFFGVSVEPSAIQKIASSEVSSQHSKRPGTNYDSATREADLLEWEQRYGHEADRAIEWAIPIAGSLRLGRIDGPVAGVAPSEIQSTPVLALENA